MKSSKVGGIFIYRGNASAQLKFLIYVLFCTLFLLFIVILVLFFLLSNKSIMYSEAEVEKPVHEYQSLTYNSRTNEVTSGFVTHYDVVPPKGIFFDGSGENTGILRLISHFGSNQYKCTGSCFCEDDNRLERRAVFSKVAKGVIVLVAGLTSIQAISLAEDYFDEKCKKRMQDEGCEENSIVPEVDDCLPLVEEENIDEDFYDSNEEELLDEEREYLCKSNCILSYAYYGGLTFAQMMSELPDELYYDTVKHITGKDYKCDPNSESNNKQTKNRVSFTKYSRNWIIDNLKEWGVLVEERLFEKAEMCSKLELETTVTGMNRRMAIETFSDNHLDKFCRKAGGKRPLGALFDDKYWKEYTYSCLFHSFVEKYRKSPKKDEVEPYFRNYCQGSIPEKFQEMKMEAEKAKESWNEVMAWFHREEEDEEEIEEYKDDLRRSINIESEEGSEKSQNILIGNGVHCVPLKADKLVHKM